MEKRPEFKTYYQLLKMRNVWRRIFVGEEVPFNDLSAEDVVTLKNMGVYSLKIRVDLSKEEVDALPFLANKYSAFKPYPEDLPDKCMIVGTYGSKEEQDSDQKGSHRVFDFSYKSKTNFSLSS